MTALEDVPVYMYEARKDGVYVNIISESSTTVEVRGKQVSLSQNADYAHTGTAEFVVSETSGTWTLAVHQPEWAPSFVVKVNGKEVKAAVKDGYIRVRRAWKAGDRLTLQFPYEVRSLERTWEYSNAGTREHNFSNWYNGFTNHYVTFCAGPLVFATDHLDKFADRHPVFLTRQEIEAASLVRGKEPADLYVKAGSTLLRPICQMPPYEGPQSRFIWFQIDKQ